MYGAGTRCLIALAAVAVVGTSTPTDAEMSRPAVPDGTYVPSTPTKPTYRRTSAPPVSRAPLRSWAGDSAAYNAGEKAAATYRGVPPHPETRDYVVRVLNLYAVPVDCCQSQGSGIERIVQADGTIMYTNMPYTLAAGR